MTKSYKILAIGITLAFAGCSGLPFFSPKGATRNPVPKPDWQQAETVGESRNAQVESKKPSDTKKEKKRTPSVVWVPENRALAKSVMSASARVTDFAGNPVGAGLNDCLDAGYALLGSGECDVTTETASESSTNEHSDNAQTAQLNTDLLGSPTTPTQIESPTANPDKVEDPIATIRANGLHGQSQPENITAKIAALDSESATSAPARLIPASYERVVLASDVLFDFAKFGFDGLNALRRQALQGLIERFAKYDATSLRKVIITGHSDRIGTPAANIKISKQRAAAVKIFLIHAGIDTDILETTGVGSVSPVKHCAGKTKSAKLKSCLAPNRRVEIEIIGAT